MLDELENPATDHRKTAGYDVEIVSIATAVPEHKYTQADAIQRSKSLMPHCAYLEPVFDHTGIETRYSCVPMDWYLDSPGWRDSNEVYLANALDLLEGTATEALANADAGPGDVDALVCVSSTGLSIPSLEARLSNRMDINQFAERLPIFGLGCAGGTSGLGRAARIAQTMEGGLVLFLVVELAGINVHVNARSPALFVSTALFGDGAAALVLRNKPFVNSPATPQPPDPEPAAQERSTAKRLSRPVRIVASGEYMWRDTEHIMGWKVEDDGLDVILSSTLPHFTEKNLRQAAESFLNRHGVSLSDLDGYVFHPGGRKVLDAIEVALDIEPSTLRHSRDILRDYGNMSAPTVLFILQRTVQSGARGLHLMVSFGPAFTTTFALLDL